MAIFIHNLRTEQLPNDSRHVYVGRANSRRRLEGSSLGNPFKPSRDMPRPEAIERYREYLNQLREAEIPNDGSIARLVTLVHLTRLAASGDLHLYCWCSPKPCHADVIKAEIERRLGATNDQ
jgi:Domain of unknown function (DUF4326)